MAGGTISIVATLGGGLVFGLKHALEVDHLAAISTIVTERRSWLSSSLVGALWGAGHTVSLMVAGAVVILLHVPIGERLAGALEFGVALMLIGLGGSALRTLGRGGHVHVHSHNGRVHVHPHQHDDAGEPHTHHPIGVRPLFVGMMHGLAGSAALMLLVLSTIPSPFVGLAYIAVFGIGSIGGMLIMSLLVSLPAQVTAARFARANFAVRTAAALFSLGLGLFMAYQIGIVGGLLG